MRLGENPEENTDNASILLRYANGTNAVINLLCERLENRTPKERVEVFLSGEGLGLGYWLN